MWRKERFNTEKYILRLITTAEISGPRVRQEQTHPDPIDLPPFQYNSRRAHRSNPDDVSNPFPFSRPVSTAPPHRIHSAIGLTKTDDGITEGRCGRGGRLGTHHSDMDWGLRVMVGG